MRGREYGTPFSKTGAISSGSAVATKAAATLTEKQFLTDVSGSSDLSGATITIKDGATVIWQDVISVGNYTMNFIEPLASSPGATLTVTVTGTSVCFANASGYSLG